MRRESSRLIKIEHFLDQEAFLTIHVSRFTTKIEGYTIFPITLHAFAAQMPLSPGMGRPAFTKPEDLPGLVNNFSFRVKGAECKSRLTFIFSVLTINTAISWKQSPKIFQNEKKIFRGGCTNLLQSSTSARQRFNSLSGRSNCNRQQIVSKTKHNW